MRGAVFPWSNCDHGARREIALSTRARVMFFLFSSVPGGQSRQVPRHVARQVPRHLNWRDIPLFCPEPVGGVSRQVPANGTAGVLFGPCNDPGVFKRCQRVSDVASCRGHVVCEAVGRRPRHEVRVRVLRESHEYALDCPRPNLPGALDVRLQCPPREIVMIHSDISLLALCDRRSPTNARILRTRPLRQIGQLLAHEMAEHHPASPQTRRRRPVPMSSGAVRGQSQIYSDRANRYAPPVPVGTLERGVIGFAPRVRAGCRSSTNDLQYPLEISDVFRRLSRRQVLSRR